MALTSDIESAYNNYLSDTLNNYFYKKLFTNETLCNGQLLFDFSITNLLHIDVSHEVDVTASQKQQILDLGETKDVC